MPERSVERVLESRLVMEGAEFPVHRCFPTRSLPYLDPFLLLDEMGPLTLHAEDNQGFPEHPHKGFETVTYMLSGCLQHRDSGGRFGVVCAGGLEWMTAGSGVIHSEMPEEHFLQAGGTLHGLQLWVNLSRPDKKSAPRYQEIPATRIPVREEQEGRVRIRILAGEVQGSRAEVRTHTPILYLHYQMAPRTQVLQPVPKPYNALVYVLEGHGRFGASSVSVPSRRMAVLDRQGEVLSVLAGSQPLSFVLIAGQPLQEPVARYGPFVMNTEEEIREAFEEYSQGKMGGHLSEGHA